MDLVKQIIALILQYGKGPAIRYIAIGVATLLGKYGVTEAQAGDFATAVWPLLAAALTAVLALATAAKSRKDLHTAPPPVTAADERLVDDTKADVIASIGQDKPKG
jgi:hypothetical protein